MFEPDPAAFPAPGRGALQQLNAYAPRTARRTVMRLHRNLGHPTNLELMKLLRQQGANELLINTAKDFKCETCELHRRPSGVPVSSIPRATTFNDRIQADTLWVSIPGRARAVPVLMISDVTTRLVAGRVLMTESSGEFIKAVERGWIRHFGPMKRLCVDEHRAWSSEAIRDWCAELGIELMISPGESHTRLAIIERRHQVVRKALTSFLMDRPDLVLDDPECLILALNYVIPQVNRMPNVSGYSPIQWTLGYTPHVPGLLVEENVDMNPAHSWIRRPPFGRSWSCNEWQLMRSTRPTSTLGSEGPCCGSTPDNRASWQQETDATTGEMGQQLEASFDGKDQQSWSCEK